eukprot:gene15932-biopygen17112
MPASTNGYLLIGSNDYGNVSEHFVSHHFVQNLTHFRQPIFVARVHNEHDCM